MDDIIKAAKELELEGVRAICGACGYLGNFQKEVAEAMEETLFRTALEKAFFGLSNALKWYVRRGKPNKTVINNAIEITWRYWITI